MQVVDKKLVFNYRFEDEDSGYDIITTYSSNTMETARNHFVTTDEGPAVLFQSGENERGERIQLRVVFETIEDNFRLADPSHRQAARRSRYGHINDTTGALYYKQWGEIGDEHTLLEERKVFPEGRVVIRRYEAGAYFDTEIFDPNEVLQHRVFIANFVLNI